MAADYDGTLSSSVYGECLRLRMIEMNASRYNTRDTTTKKPFCQVPHQ